MPYKLESGIFCILDSKGAPSGTGFLVSKTIGVTCFHVIDSQNDTVHVRFIGEDNDSTATILRDFRDEKEDVAILQFDDTPSNAIPVKLGTSSDSKSGSSFRSFGYPKLDDFEGVHARGEILGSVKEKNSQYLHIRSQELEKGFSGAPVLDENLKYVTGMVVSIFKSSSGRRLRDTAFAIPTETLWRIYPDIKPSEICPYMGLDAFTAETAQFFFGRGLLTQKLLGVLQNGYRFLAVLGPSGSGKSSVVKAGLLPALQRGAIPESEFWLQVIMRPADNPFEQLNSNKLYDSDINQYLENYSGKKKLILFIDQFEEIFTICPEDLRHRFVEFLISALESSKFILIISMRDDFYSSFYSKAGKLTESENLKIENIPGALKQQELAEIIEKPAKLAGLSLDEGLADLITKDVLQHGEARSSILPLLEFALTQLWHGRRHGCLTHESYKQIGGVAGSLARWADEAYSDLPKENRLLAENLLTSLVHLGDENQIPDTRRRRTLGEFGNSIEARSIIQHFSDRRLIVTSRDNIELIHDAILFEWGQLSKWLNENRSFLTWLQKTSERLKEWNIGNGELLRGRDLAVAQEMWGKKPIVANQIIDLGIIETYISASVKQAQRIRWLTTGSISIAFIFLALFGGVAWNQRNIAVNSQATTTAGMATQAEAILKEQFAVSTAQAALLTAQAESTLTTLFQEEANENKETARQENILKLSENLSKEALSTISTNYNQSLLLGIESFRLLQEQNLADRRFPDVVPDLLNKAPTGIVQTLSFTEANPVTKVLFTPNGDFLATLGNTLTIWDTQDPEYTTPLSSWELQSEKMATDVSFSSNSNIMAIGLDNGNVELWDISKDVFTKISTIESPFDHADKVNTKTAFSVDNTILAVSGNKTIILFDTTNPGNPFQMGQVTHPHKGTEVEYLWFDPNQQNHFLVSGGGDGLFRVWNLWANNYKPSAPQRSIPREAGVSDIAISSKYVIVATGSTITIYYNFNTSFAEINSFEYSSESRGLITSMSINNDSTRLFTSNLDGEVVEWDISNPKSVYIQKKYNGHTNSINSIALHPKGKFLITSGADARVIVWNVAERNLTPIQKNIIDGLLITEIDYNPAKNLIILGDEEGNVSTIDSSNIDLLEYQRRFMIDEHPVERILIAPNEEYVSIAGGDNNPYRPTYYLYDLTRNSVKRIFETNTTGILAPGNQFILAGEVGDGSLKIFRWDISGSTITRDSRPLAVGACPYLDISYAIETKRSVIATCNLQVWDFSDDNMPVLISELNTSMPNGATISKDGRRVASANSNGSISIWELKSGGEYELVSTINNPHFYGITSISISPDGNTLVSGGEDRAVTIWDITDVSNPSRRVSFYGHSDFILHGGLFFTGDGNTVISTSKMEVVFWDVDTDSWLYKACRIAGRNLTEPEWKQYIGSDIPYHLTCPELPKP